MTRQGDALLGVRKTGVRGMRGKKPKPAPSKETKYLKLIRPDLDAASPAPAGPAVDERFAAPDYFCDVARGVWDFLVEHLTRQDLLEGADIYKLEVFSNAVADYRRCQAFFSAPSSALEGAKPNGRTYTVSGRNGSQIKPRPEVAMQNTAIAVIDKFGSEFGLSPVARARLRAPVGEADDGAGLFDTGR